jgi:hypothetical protein
MYRKRKLFLNSDLAKQVFSLRRTMRKLWDPIRNKVINLKRCHLLFLSFVRFFPIGENELSLNAFISMLLFSAHTPFSKKGKKLRTDSTLQFTIVKCHSFNDSDGPRDLKQTILLNTYNFSSPTIPITMQAKS